MPSQVRATSWNLHVQAIAKGLKPSAPILGAAEAQELKNMAFPVIEVEPKSMFRLGDGHCIVAQPIF